MKIVVECIYEKGNLRPLEKLDLTEGERVKVVIEKYALSREEFLKMSGIKEDDIVEFDLDKELEILKKLREKAKQRCQY